MKITKKQGLKFTPKELDWIKYLIEDDEDSNGYTDQCRFRTKINNSIITKIKNN